MLYSFKLIKIRKVLKKVNKTKGKNGKRNNEIDRSSSEKVKKNKKIIDSEYDSDDDESY